MATYDELYGLKDDSGLKNKVTAACIISAESILAEDGGTANHANRLIWAAAVFASPGREADRMYWAVLAANKDATVAQIQSATDAAIQTNVDNHVDLFATG
jgi:hypothetical protein